ncbi:DNA topoisomerase I [Asticcacaulis biprosthecium C19]|uniref:DNA topoisomerase 1 n=1 Tax=Asticcacaulis biprosthecium C19 TaxID=715226 RepID=F4QST6_9CAUL|nr:type I DNA topoisomerase [Asticcacaulis biprosthecium]EGF89806.1 DNA topoisomerase I [Asticcacaulis biprosthecium C19]
MTVVIVESPAKAKTINKYLGKGYTVLASYGHIRDLPSKDGSVKPDEDFAMTWDMDPKSSKRLSDIADAVKSADRVILATDPDREGEAISWHVLEVLTKKRVLKDKVVQRVTFNAITQSAVQAAMAAPRELDMELVEAYLARRALDYLVGFTLSPVLWRKLPGARSAGRVQSVALKIVVDREIEIEKFRTEEYWTVESEVSAESPPFTARLVQLAGKKLAKFDLNSEVLAHAARDTIQTSSFSIEDVEQKPGRKTPPPPFTTSTLQQEAARKLGFSASRTMQTAQKLYEGVDIGGETTGLITYMRTDGVFIEPNAIAENRRMIGERFGAAYVPAEPRHYKVKAKNAQEAHEAIRPTSMFRRPDTLRHLDPDQARLYELIWKRTVASQMEAARVENTVISILSSDKQTGLRATGQVITFDGYLAVYEEGKDEVEDEDGGRLPAVRAGTATQVHEIKPAQHFTEPPARYSEATLVKKLEELGIGRPSTYASILTVLRDRAYVRMDKNRFIPEDKGRLVTAFLDQFFHKYVQYDFTADLEEKLDLVSAGELNWKQLLRDFWTDFHAAADGMTELRVTQVLDTLNEALGPHIFPDKGDGSNPRACPTCSTGLLSLKTSRFGAFIGCSNYPECKFTRPVGSPDSEGNSEASGDRDLGADPETGKMVSLKIGRFGPYVQLGEAESKEDKPKRSSLPKAWPPATIDLERALKLLSLPRTVGVNPEDGKPITAGLGRFGPFVASDGTFANLSGFEEIFEVGLNRAVTLIAEKRAGGGRPGRAGAAAALKELGDHPESGDKIQVMAGRYGPYVKCGKVNATLPKEMTPETVTVEQALALIAAKGGVTSKKAPAKKAAAKKPAAKKATTAKKAPAKKAKTA